jgi:hypothetical protein
MRPRHRPLAKRVALQLLEWYPRPWRARYSSEMRALLEEMPVGWPQTVNVAATAVREWLSPRALGWPARTAAGRIGTARGWMFLAGAMLVDALARLLATKISGAGVTDEHPLRYVVYALTLLTMIRMFSVPTFRSEKSRTRQWLGAVRKWRQPLTLGEIWFCAAMILPFQVLRYLGDPDEYALREFFSSFGPFINLFLVWSFSNHLRLVSLHTRRLQRVEASRQKSWRPKWVDPGEDSDAGIVQ